MDNLFLALFLLSLVALAVGLVKPQWVRLSSRKRVGGVFGGAAIVSLILFSVTMPSTSPQTAAQAATTPVAMNASNTPTTLDTGAHGATQAQAPASPQSSGAVPTQKPAAVIAAAPSQSAPVQQPQPVPPPAPQPTTPAPVTISGSGQTASRQFTLQQGLAVFSMQYTGPGNFIVQLLDSSGDQIGTLSNQIGNYSGSQALQIPDSGSYLFNVQAGSIQQSGSWSITITQPVPSGVSSASTLSGTGDEATQFFHLSHGLHTFTLNYIGGGNFIVQLLDQYGDEVDDLENAIGTTNGSVAVPISTAGSYLLNVQAGSVTSNGTWSVGIQ